MRVAALLVAHRLAVAGTGTSFAPCLHELVGVPLAVVRYPCRNVVCPLPEHEPHGRFVEPHHDIRIRADAPQMVPCRLEFQAGVIRAKRSSACRSRWQHRRRNDFTLWCRCGYNLLSILVSGYRAVLQSHFVKIAVERVVAQLHRPADPGRKSILRLPHPTDDERGVYSPARSCRSR